VHSHELPDPLKWASKAKDRGLSIFQVIENKWCRVNRSTCDLITGGSSYDNIVVDRNGNVLIQEDLIF
jgi:hypothetical protein